MIAELPILHDLSTPIPEELNRVQRRQLRLYLWRQNPCCTYCHRKLPYRHFTLDHFKPISLGGRHVESNLVLCCELCNRAKADQSTATFMERLEIALATVRRMIEADAGFPATT